MNWFAQREWVGVRETRIEPEIIHRVEEKKDSGAGSKEMWPERLREALEGKPGQKTAQEGEEGGRQSKEGIRENHALGCWPLEMASEHPVPAK